MLVAIFQRGAVDGLNMVVPYGEQRLLRVAADALRFRGRDRAISAALDLDGFFAFHPRLAAAAEALRAAASWRSCTRADRRTARGRTSTRRTTWKAARRDARARTDGWLNRYLQAKHDQEHSNFRAVSLTQQLPRTLQGHAPALAMTQIGQFGIRGDDMMSASFESQYARRD